MNAEILSIGTELLLGETADSNALFLSQQLRDSGIHLYYRTTVGDNPERISDALKLALSRSDLVITTGGLGPTDGDITRDAVARVCNEPMTEAPELVEHITRLFAARGRPMAERNRKQALVIPSAEVLANPIGTAPGWLVTKNGKRIVTLPGPPHEMQRMWLEQARPRLPHTDCVLFCKVFHTLGMGESTVSDLLGELTRRANPTVATYSRAHGLDIRVAAGAADHATAQHCAEPVVTRLRELFADHIYGEDTHTLADAVGCQLIGRGQTLSIGEGFSGGLLCDLITESSDCSRFFRDGHIFGAAPTFGPPVLDRPPAELLAWIKQCHTHFPADWYLVTSGSPSVDRADGANGFSVWFGVSGPGGVGAEYMDWPSERRFQKQRTAHWALMLLLRRLRDTSREIKKF